MNSKDYYEILGISKNATPEEIKKAYRRLVHQWHPDKHREKETEEEAEKRFREIGEAYSTLSDPDERAKYDNGSQQPQFHQGFDPFSLFNQFKQQAQHFQRPIDPPLPTLFIALELTLEEFHTGTTKHIKFIRLMPCVKCNGTGSLTKITSTCTQCAGTGRISNQQHTPMGFLISETPCYTCNATGQVISDPCVHCQGEKYERKENKIDVTIPIGSSSGQQFHYHEGHVDIKTKRAGLLVVQLIAKQHSLFGLVLPTHDGNLSMNHRINIFEALLGTKLEFIGIDGKRINVAIPPRTSYVSELKVAEQGLARNNTTRGDLFIFIEADFPTLTDENKNKLRKIWEE